MYFEKRKCYKKISAATAKSACFAFKQMCLTRHPDPAAQAGYHWMIHKAQ